MKQYGRYVTVKLPWDAAVSRTLEALKEEDFTAVMELDVRKAVETSTGEESRPYIIFGACVPSLTHRVISADPAMGLLMPCTVCVWDNGDGTSTVGAVDVKDLVGLQDEPAYGAIVKLINAKLHAALDWIETTPMNMPASSAAE